MPQDHITQGEIESPRGYVPIGAEIPPELDAALRSHAERTDRSLASVIRLALAEHLAKQAA